MIIIFHFWNYIEFIFNFTLTREFCSLQGIEQVVWYRTGLFIYPQAQREHGWDSACCHPGTDSGDAPQYLCWPHLAAPSPAVPGASLLLDSHRQIDGNPTCMLSLEYVIDNFTMSVQLIQEILYEKQVIWVHVLLYIHNKGNKKKSFKRHTYVFSLFLVLEF